MQALEYWKAVTAARVDFLDRVVETLSASGARYCVVGGQAVNAYVEPVVSLDLDIAVATAGFAHRVNVSATGSDLRVQLQTDPRYTDFTERASPRSVLGLTLPVGSLEDVLQGKVWAAQDPARRASMRQKDLADIARLLETYPQLRARVPPVVLDRLL